MTDGHRGRRDSEPLFEADWSMPGDNPPEDKPINTQENKQENKEPKAPLDKKEQEKIDSLSDKILEIAKKDNKNNKDRENGKSSYNEKYNGFEEVKKLIASSRKMDNKELGELNRSYTELKEALSKKRSFKEILGDIVKNITGRGKETEREKAKESLKNWMKNNTSKAPTHNIIISKGRNEKRGGGLSI